MNEAKPKSCPGLGQAVQYVFIAALLAVGVALHQLTSTAELVRTDTLRLHVVANSNTIEDQLTKLKARDAVLAAAAPLLEGAAAREEAAAILEENHGLLEQAVTQAIGGSQPVRVVLTRQHFPTTRYEGFTLPEGDYQALRVELGEAAGHNWFCVLYPALCLSGTEAEYDDPAENRLVFGSHEIRFALLEWLEKLDRLYNSTDNGTFEM